MNIKEPVDPGCSEAHFPRKASKLSPHEMTEVVGRFDRHRRKLPLQALPQRFDRIEMWRADGEKDKFDFQICSSFSGVLTGVI